MTSALGIATILLLLPPMTALPARAENPPLTAARTLRFEIGKPEKLDLVVGGVKLHGFRVERVEARLLDSVLPPRGGQTRFSWLRYAFEADNPDSSYVQTRARVAVMDEAGAIIDEFEFESPVAGKRSRTVELRRLTLNYAVPLAKSLQVTFTIVP